MEEVKSNEGEVKENVVIINDNDNESTGDIDALSPSEIEMAKKLKVDIDNKEEKKEASKKSNDVKSKEVKKEEEIPVEDLDTFDKLHDLYKNKPEAFYRLPRNIKQLYHGQKGLYKSMKDEESKRKAIEDEVGLKKIKDSVARIKLDRIKSRLSNPEGLTVEEIQELIDDKKEAENNVDSKDKPLTVKDLEAIKAKEQEEELKRAEEEKTRQVATVERIKEAEEIANANINDITGGKYSNFDDVVALAQEMVKTKARYGAQIASAINSDSDVQEIVDVIIDIARLNPKWGTSADSGKNNDKTVDRLVKNASRQATSASLAGGKGGREVHISADMDIEDAYRVWDKIPRQIQKEILKRA